MDKRDTYASVQAKILDALEQGTVPWRKPWRSAGGYPVNIRSGKPYRGVNVLLLSLEGYGDPRWGTYDAIKTAAVDHARKQGREVIVEQTRKGKLYFEILNGEKARFYGGVRAKEKSTQVILWKPVRTRREDANGEMQEGKYMFLRFYSVFNAKQADGLPELDIETREFTPIERANEIVTGYIYPEGSGPPVRYGYAGAAFNVTCDEVEMPEAELFDSDEAFYCTLFHELVHSTGHPSRLKRIEPALFGSEPYGKEELVAEMGSSFLAGLSDFEVAGGEQSAAYIANWMKTIKGDVKMVVNAAAQAQKATDLILGTTFEDEKVGEVEREVVAV